jgi:hypothetical protein
MMGWPQFEVCEGDNCYFTLQSLMILCPSYLIFMVLNGGLSVPGGLFMPGIMVRVMTILMRRHSSSRRFAIDALVCWFAVS